MTLDKDLCDSIAGFVSSGHAGLTILDRAHAASLVGEVAERFVSDANALWWWESLADEPWEIAYRDTDGLQEIERLLQKATTPLYLVVTDDEHPPWLVVRGELGAIIALLREQRVFEFFIVDESRSWVIFDTHHGSLSSLVATSWLLRPDNRYLRAAGAPLWSCPGSVDTIRSVECSGERNEPKVPRWAVSTLPTSER